MYVIACHGKKGYLRSLFLSPGLLDGADLDVQFSYDQYIRFNDESEALSFLDVLTDLFDDENFIILEV